MKCEEIILAGGVSSERRKWRAESVMVCVMRKGWKRARNNPRNFALQIFNPDISDKYPSVGILELKGIHNLS